MTHEHTMKAMRRMGEYLKQQLPPGYGFFLTIFEYEKTSRANYISTGRREDMIKMLRETAYRLEHHQDEGSLK